MWIMDYAGFAQLCGSAPIMRKIMRTPNRIIPPSLEKTFYSDDLQCLLLMLSLIVIVTSLYKFICLFIVCKVHFCSD